MNIKFPELILHHLCLKAYTDARFNNLLDGGNQGGQVVFFLLYDVPLVRGPDRLSCNLIGRKPVIVRICQSSYIPIRSNFFQDRRDVGQLLMITDLLLQTTQREPFHFSVNMSVFNVKLYTKCHKDKKGIKKAVTGLVSVPVSKTLV